MRPERGELSVRPAWWREFLQKVKMFFYGFKGFSNYRFTDREIETLLLRGYRKTRNARGAKAEGGDARFAALRREGAPNTADKPGQMRDSHVPHEEGFMEKYKFSGKGLYADYEFLYGRHPEYFEDAEHVRAAVEFVLAQPEEAVDVEGNAAFVRRDEETGTPYRIEIEKTTRAKYNHIRSVHVLSEQQYEKAKVGATPANAASPVLQPSLNRVRQTDTNGDLTGRNGRTVSDFLRYDSTESGKVKHSPEGGARFSIDEEGKPLFNVQGYGEQKLESILQDKSISAKTQILTDDGSPDWGRVTPEMIANAPADLNLKALPIRLFKGDYGYGLVHLSKHLKDFTGRDLSNVILNVFGKPNKIYARRDGDAIKLEVFPKPPSQWGILELREEQGCYSVVTFYPRDNAHSKPKGEMIWRFGSQTETSQAASDQSRNGATGETPQVTQEETTVQTSHNINPFDIKVKYALEDGSDFSDGADKYTLENAKASKEGYRVERVNENAGRDLTEAQGVVCEVNQVFNPEEAPEKGFKGWVLKKIREYETAHHLKGKYDTPALASEVNIVESSIRSIGNHAGPDAKYNLYPAIPDMLKNAVLIQTEAHDAQGSSSVLSRSHLLATKVRYGENRYVVVMVIHESNGEFYYDHSLLLLKEGELGNRKAEIDEAEESKWNPAKTAGPASSSAQVLKVAREALLSSGFDTKSEKNLRFSIEQYSDADWSDMVTYLKAKVGNLLTKPDAEYKKILEDAGMECYSEADAHACAAEAMQQNERELRERGKQRRDKWIYENELLYRLVVDFAGSDKFTLVPDSFTGEKFTGTWIAEEYRKYSEKRAQKPTESDKQYKRYLQTREKALARAKGYRLDEVAEAIARKTGRDTLEVQEELVDYQNLKEGTSWGREGAARRLAAMTLDSIERV